jgi:hypothetical protein
MASKLGITSRHDAAASLRSGSRKGTGFVQPLAVHDHWHVDISYLNVAGMECGRAIQIPSGRRDLLEDGQLHHGGAGGGGLGEVADEGGDDFFEGGADDGVAEVGEHVAGVAGGADLHVERDFAEEGDFQFFGFRTGAAAAEDVVALAAAFADEAAHVFDHAEDGDVDRVEHRDGPLGVEQGDLLRRADDDGAGDGEDLREGEGDVAGAGGHVDDEIVEIAPGDVAEELRDVGMEHRAAPDDRFARREQKAHRHDGHAVEHDGRHLAIDDSRGWSAFEPEEMGDAGAINVGIEEADFAAGAFEAQGERGGDGAFADAALAGADGDDALGREADLAELLRWALVDGEVDFYVGERGEAGFDEICQPLLGFLPEGGGVRREGEREGGGGAGDGQIADLLLAGEGEARFGVFEFGEGFFEISGGGGGGHGLLSG